MFSSLEDTHTKNKSKKVLELRRMSFKKRREDLKLPILKERRIRKDVSNFKFLGSQNDVNTDQFSLVQRYYNIRRHKKLEKRIVNKDE